MKPRGSAAWREDAFLTAIATAALFQPAEAARWQEAVGPDRLVCTEERRGGWLVFTIRERPDLKPLRIHEDLVIVDGVGATSTRPSSKPQARLN